MTRESKRDAQIEAVARMIYEEVSKQIDANRPNTSAIVEAGSLRHVLIEGHIDLIRVAATLAKRYGLSTPSIETVSEERLAAPAPLIADS